MRHFLKHLRTPFVILALCVGLTAFPQTSHAVVPDSQVLDFKIYRNGALFGNHNILFETDKNGLTIVEIDIQMAYKVGPIALFRYEHFNREIWDEDQILSVQSETYDDGDDYLLEASWDEAANAVDVTINNESYDAPFDILSTSYWNKASITKSQLLNTQKGRTEDITVTFLGEEELEVHNTIITAERYAVDSVVPIEVLYDKKTDQWVGLEFKARGSHITYKRTTPIP